MNSTAAENVISTKICGNCGAENKAADKFCCQCGSRIDAQQPSQPVSPIVPPVSAGYDFANETVSVTTKRRKTAENQNDSVPVSSPVIEPESETVAMPVSSPVIEPEPEKAVAPVASPIIEPESETVAMPVSNAQAEPMAEKVDEKPVDVLVDCLVEQIVTKHVNQYQENVQQEAKKEPVNEPEQIIQEDEQEEVAEVSDEPTIVAANMLDPTIVFVRPERARKAPVSKKEVTEPPVAQSEPETAPSVQKQVKVEEVAKYDEIFEDVQDTQYDDNLNYTTVCQNCGAVNASSGAFCVNCGTSLSYAATPNQSVKICPVCGNTNESTAAFCVVCGSGFSADMASNNINNNQIECGVCGYMNDSDCAFCVNCGSNLSGGAVMNNVSPGGKECPICGYLNHPDSPYCNSCGSSFAIAQPATQQVEPDVPEKPKKKKTGKVIAIVLVVLLILAGAGVAAYFFIDFDKDGNKDKEPTSVEDETNEDENDDENNIAVEEPTTSVDKEVVLITELKNPSVDTVVDEYRAIVSAKTEYVDEVYVYYGPDAALYDIVCEVSNGYEVTVLTEDSEGWTMIEYDGKKGWIMSKFIEDLPVDESVDSYFNAFNEFYKSYLDGINNNNADLIVYCTEDIKDEMSERFQYNQKSYFDLQSVKFDRDTFVLSSGDGKHGSFVAKCSTQLYDRETSEAKSMNYAVWNVTVEKADDGSLKVVYLERLEDDYPLGDAIFEIIDNVNILDEF